MPVLPRFLILSLALAAALPAASRLDAKGAQFDGAEPATRPSQRGRAEVRWRAEDADLSVRDADAVVIDYGTPAWSDAARAVQKERSWRWRAGCGGWTMLRTEGALLVGDVRVRPGSYALLVQREGGKYLLAFVEERLLAGHSPSDLSSVPRGVTVPLEVADAPKAHRRLSFEFRADRRGGRSALNPPRRLVIGFNTAELSVAVSPDRQDTVIGPPSAQSVFRSSPKTGSADDVVRAASAAAARWLVEHQSDDGRWDSDGFPAEGDPAKGPLCDGRGSMQRDARTTALAILVLLGEGGTHVDGRYADALRRGLGFLLRSQQPNGLVPHVEQTGPEQTTLTWTNGDHAVVAWALAEAWGASGSPRLRDAAGAAIKYLLEVRSGSAWKDHPQQEDEDMISTGWASLALAAAREAGDLALPADALQGALALTASLTDEQCGRTGFDRRIRMTPRYESQSSLFPPESAEGCTAAGLLVRHAVDRAAVAAPVFRNGVGLLSSCLPRWDANAGTIDFYYWCLGSFAMRAGGSESEWTAWDRALRKALLPAQRNDGNFRGSWDAVDAWSSAFGRVEATATNALALQASRRYAPPKIALPPRRAPRVG